MASGGGIPSAGDYRAVVEALFAQKPHGTKLGLDRMRLLVPELGHPERRLRVLHVGGTNGKGSVAAMIESILRGAGLKVGLYTSPHLIDVGERVQVNRVPLSPTEVIAYADELRPAADRVDRRHGAEGRPSFFELMTAMALLHFQRKACDLAVFEVGMGGEFDATNVLLPEVSVITSVGLDHCEWLGHTLEEIARTKAGIIKPRRPVVLGRLPAVAEKAIREIASRQDAPVVSVRARYGEATEGYPITNLAGEYQRWNAATATLAIRSLSPGWRISEAGISEGLGNVRWPGRWEQVTVGGRILVLDASHNPEGAAVLDTNLRDLVRRTGRAPVVIVGVLGAERAGPLLATVCAHAREVHLVVPAQPRASSYAELESLIPPAFTGRVVRSSVAGLFPTPEVCSAGGPEDVVVVTGSIYLLGEVMSRLHWPAA